jgi:hypothetical protein
MKHTLKPFVMYCLGPICSRQGNLTLALCWQKVDFSVLFLLAIVLDSGYSE